MGQLCDSRQEVRLKRVLIRRVTATDSGCLYRKKGKKGKGEPDPPAPDPPAMDTVDLGASATADATAPGDANAEDEWVSHSHLPCH